MADKKDYYEVLGLQRGATDDDIKKAYRKLAKENHPDLHPGDKGAEARFKEINEAYEVLSNPDKRSKYDQFGFAGVDPSYGAGQPGAGGFGGFNGFSGFSGEDFDLGDIFGSFFGGGFGGGQGAQKNAARRGEGIRISLSLSFEEAAFGCKKDINVSRIEECEDCRGSGCEKGTTPEVCPNCHGSGQVRVQRNTMLGVMQTASECPRCGGTGKIIHQPCKTCRGAGTVRRQRSVNVTVPAGLDDGQTISLRGQGHAGANGGPAGDLLITISVRPHEFFTREGTSVMCEMPITVTQAILGSEIEVPTLDGAVKYTVPAGTQSGTVFRLRGKGIPFLHGSGRGDQYVTVSVEIPKNLSASQRELVRQLDESMGGNAGKARRPRKKIL